MSDLHEDIITKMVSDIMPDVRKPPLRSSSLSRRN